MKTPAFLKKVLPRVEWVVNTKPVAPKKRRRALVFACLSCGAALKLKHDVERIITCEYCHKQMYLSDDAWRLLHSVATSRPWGLIFPGRTLAVKKLPPKQEPSEPTVENPQYGWLTIEMQYPCPSCGDPIILNGPARVYRCQTCGYLLHLRKSGLAETIADASERTRSMFSKYDFTIYKNRQGPRCPVCQKSGPYQDNLNKIDNNEAVVCSACGHRLVHFPVPRWLQQLLPAAGRLFNADREQELAGYKQIPDTAAMEVFISCPTCGGGNRIMMHSDTAKTVPCVFCGSAIIIPREIWFRYHPVPVFVPWTITHKLPELKFRQQFFNRIWEKICSELRWKFGERWQKIKKWVRNKLLRRATVMQVTILINCKSCGREIPINSPALDFACAHCMATGTLTPYRFAEDLTDGAVQLEGQICHNPASGYTIRAKSVRKLPCSSCGAPVAVPKKALASGAEVAISCKKCGTVQKGGPPPEWMSRSLPAVLGILPLSPHKTRGTEVRESQESVMSTLQCPVCSRNAAIDALSARTVTCAGCKNELYIPDSIWCKLHPVVTAAPWVLVFRKKLEVKGDGSKAVNQVFI